MLEILQIITILISYSDLILKFKQNINNIIYKNYAKHMILLDLPIIYDSCWICLLIYDRVVE
jgi:hypothetical protein